MFVICYLVEYNETSKWHNIIIINDMLIYKYGTSSRSRAAKLNFNTPHKSKVTLVNRYTCYFSIGQLALGFYYVYWNLSLFKGIPCSLPINIKQVVIIPLLYGCIPCSCDVIKSCTSIAISLLSYVIQTNRSVNIICTECSILHVPLLV